MWNHRYAPSGAPQAQLEFQRLAGRKRALLCSDERRQIVGMYTR